VSNLWIKNTPADFWKLDLDVTSEEWEEAVRQAYPHLGLTQPYESLPALMELTLGEGQFGAKRWRLSNNKRLYYLLKPYIPRQFIRFLRSKGVSKDAHYPLRFPIEDRYIRFLRETARRVLVNRGITSAPFAALWPQGKQYAFCIRHDVEEKAGCEYVRELASIDEAHGFRSVFNFVVNRYPVDRDLLSELNERGHEVGVHGLQHDGKDFFSKGVFMQRAPLVNRALAAWDSVTYCAPLTHRQPEWLQALDIEYDQSFFDTDPNEPMVGGVMTIFPFFIGKFVEMPYTLVQDHSLKMLLRETTPRLWLEKVAYVQQNNGMALVNSHPDYLLNDRLRSIYTDFLSEMQRKRDYWHALPRDVARWWRQRYELPVCEAQECGTLRVVNGELAVTAGAVSATERLG
jgi:hypothetical protein